MEESPFVRMFHRRVGALPLVQVAVEINELLPVNEIVTPQMLGKWRNGKLLPRKAQQLAVSKWFGVLLDDLRRCVGASGKYIVSRVGSNMAISSSEAGAILRATRLSAKLSQVALTRLLASRGAAASGSVASWELRLDRELPAKVIQVYADLDRIPFAQYQAAMTSAFANMGKQLELPMKATKATKKCTPVSEPAPRIEAAPATQPQVMTRERAYKALTTALPPSDVPPECLSHWGWYIARIVELLPE